MNTEMHTLTDAELNLVSGASPGDWLKEAWYNAKHPTTGVSSTIPGGGFPIGRIYPPTISTSHYY